jgi:hypothetical protein
MQLQEGLKMGLGFLYSAIYNVGVHHSMKIVNRGRYIWVKGMQRPLKEKLDKLDVCHVSIHEISVRLSGML